MRKIWTMIAVMALASGVAASAQTSPADTYSSVNQKSVSSADPRRDRLTDHPERILLSLAALTEFILVIVIATKHRDGRPASP